MKPRRGVRIGAALLTQHHIRRRVQYGLAVVTIVLVVYGIFLWTLPLPNTWVALKSNAEAVSFRAIDPNLATFHVSGMVAHTLDGKLNACTDAIVTPGPNVQVQYRRGSDDFFRITVGPAAPGADSLILREKSKDYAATPFRDTVVFTASKECGGVAPRRLPIWGPAEFGEELRPASASGEIAPGMLLSGTLEVYAHAHERLLGLPFPASVYSVMTFDLPPGSVLASEARSADEATWTGIATFSSDGTGFKIAVTSNAPSVVLRSSRTFGTSRTASRRIDLGHHAQVLRDPNILSIQILGGVLILLLQSVLSIARFFTEGADRDDDVPGRSAVASTAPDQDKIAAQQDPPPKRPRSELIPPS